MAKNYTALVVSHTHWDREWYLPFQRFRSRLVDLIDQLLDILDSEPEYRYFTLDGQTVVLNDYLEIRPENRARLEGYIREGRILIGPWYVLPDEFLVSPESLVRNLLLGQQIAREFGAIMPVGYLPDTFGHPAQMPQILRGFGLDNAVIYRGVQTKTSEFLWEAPDGSRALTVFLPGSYCNAMQMTAAPNRFLARLELIIGNVKEMATTDTLLLMNGSDHLPPRREILQIISEANRRLDVQAARVDGPGHNSAHGQEAPAVALDFDGDGVVLEQGTLPQYVERIRTGAQALPVLKGEFRKAWPGRVLPGVVSARMYLKQENFKSSIALERYAEPLNALAWALGGPYPQPFLRQAWRYLLQNHPHDSICGCSVDSVHRDMLARYRWTQDIANEFTARGLHVLTQNVRRPDGDVASFLAFNPLLQARQDYAIQYVDFFTPSQEFHVRDHCGRIVPHQIVKRQSVLMHYDPFLRTVQLEGNAKPALLGQPPSEIDDVVHETVWRQWMGEEVELLLSPSEIPAGGYITYLIAASRPDETPSTDLHAGADWLENDLIKLTVRSDGTLDILDKRSDVHYEGLNVFQSSGDAGDEYTYCPPVEDTVVSSTQFPPSVTVVETGPVRATLEIRYEMSLPQRLMMDRKRRGHEMVSYPLKVRISLAAGSPRIEVRVEVDNRAEDHALRVLFPTEIHTGWSYAQGQFQVVERPVEVEAAERNHIPGPDEEVAVNTYPQHHFVDVSNGECGLAILNKGLAEYEVLPGDSAQSDADASENNGVTIALTLLRAVGWLSRPDLATRPGNAGPFVPVEDAQCGGTQVFEYAILPHSGTWYTGGVHQEAERYVTPPICAALWHPPAQPALKAKGNGHSHDEIGGTDGPTVETDAVSETASVWRPNVGADGSVRPGEGREMPLEHSFVSVEPSDLLFSALKQAESGDWLILRVHNVGSQTVEARVQLGLPLREARLVNLAEEEIAAEALLPDADNVISFPVRGNEICTLKVIH